jgi:O-antigen/teichoic acid export membrane protein
MTNRSLSAVTVRSMAWSGTGIASRALLQLAVLVVLSRQLTQAEYGAATALISVYNLCWLFFENGIGMAVLQRPNLDEARIRTAFTMAIIVSIGVPGTVAILAQPLSSFLSMPALAGALYLLCAGMFVRSFSIISEFLLHRDLNFRRLAITEFVSFGVGFASVAIVAGISGAGMWSIALGQFGYCVMKTLLLSMSRRHPARLLLDWRLLKEMTYFAGGFATGSALATASNEIDKLLVGRILGGASLGIYGRSVQMFLMPTSLLGQVVDRVLFSVLASVKSDPTRVQRAMRDGTAFLSIIVLPASVAVAALAPELIKIILGPEWSNVVELLQILCVCMYLRTSVKVSEGIIRAQGEVYRRSLFYALSTVLVAISTIIGSQWGLVGVTAGIMITTFVFFAIMTGFSLKLSNITVKEYIRIHVPGLLLALVLGIEAVVFLPSLRFAFDSAWLVLLSGGFAAVMTVTVLCFILPKVFLNAESQGIVERLLGRLRSYTQSLGS